MTGATTRPRRVNKLRDFGTRQGHDEATTRKRRRMRTQGPNDVFFPIFLFFFIYKNELFSFLDMYLHISYQLHVRTPGTGLNRHETRCLGPKSVYMFFFSFFPRRLLINN